MARYRKDNRKTRRGYNYGDVTAMKNFGVMVDYTDCVAFWQWKSKEDIRNYIEKCKQTGIQLLVLRLSEIGDFVHHTKLERQITERYRTDDKDFSIYSELDVLEVFSELTRRNGIKLFAWFTMFDEGWFPRFRTLAENVREHYRHILETEAEIKDLAKWISRPVPEGYEKIIPAVEMGEAIPADKPWSFYSRFAKAHPEYLCRNRRGHAIGRMLSYAYEEVRKYRISMIYILA